MRCRFRFPRFKVAEGYVFVFEGTKAALWASCRCDLFCYVLLSSCDVLHLLFTATFGLFDPMKQRKGKESLAGTGRVVSQTWSIWLTMMNLLLKPNDPCLGLCYQGFSLISSLKCGGNFCKPRLCEDLTNSFLAICHTYQWHFKEVNCSFQRQTAGFQLQIWFQLHVHLSLTAGCVGKWWLASPSWTKVVGLSFKRIRGPHSARALTGQGVTLAPPTDPYWSRLTWA